MATTYKAIATVTVGSGGAASISFSSIPSTYTDLLILYSGRDVRTGDVYSNWKIEFNGSSSNLSCRLLYGTGSSAASGTDTTIYGWQPGDSATASTFSNNLIYIPNYTSSNYKSVSIDTVEENNTTSAYMGLTAGLWSNTAAITSITIKSYYASVNQAQYSTATLYGIKNS